MSIVAHGRSRLNCVCRWANGLCSAVSPLIHIFDGENVCIQRIRPAQFGVGVGLEAELRDLVGRRQQRLEDRS